jgi:hypothetical protein
MQIDVQHEVGRICKASLWVWQGSGADTLR